MTVQPFPERQQLGRGSPPGPAAEKKIDYHNQGPETLSE